MGEERSETGQGAAGRVDRRKLLKGAAAVGVGAAAWSAPNIQTLGMTPAGAVHTPTTAITSLLSDCDSLNANCGSPNCTVGEWGSNADPSQGAITIKKFPTSTTQVIATANGCASTGGFVSVTTNPAGYTCMIEDVLISNSGNAAMSFVLVASTSGSDPVAFPGVAMGTGQCPYFICVTVTCTTT